MSTNQNDEIEAKEKAELSTEDTRTGPVFRPDVDILEQPDAYVVLADMPGVSEETVDIRLEKGTLTLDAREARETPTGPAGSTRYAEYRSGGYHREFRISEEIDAASVSAQMRDGVLELRLPKSVASRPRRIEVSAA
jgi:HSP20 family molecular chaperone IbpA